MRATGSLTQGVLAVGASAAAVAASSTAKTLKHSCSKPGERTLITFREEPTLPSLTIRDHKRG
jgi:hypothetical protein